MIKYYRSWSTLCERARTCKLLLQHAAAASAAAAALGRRTILMFASGWFEQKIETTEQRQSYTWPAISHETN